MSQEVHHPRQKSSIQLGKLGFYVEFRFLGTSFITDTRQSNVRSVPAAVRACPRRKAPHFFPLSPVLAAVAVITHILKAFHGCLSAHTRLFGTPAGVKKAVEISHDTKHLAHQPQIILIKTNIRPFHCDFTPLLPGIWCCALFHIPCSPAPSSRYTPFDLSGKKKFLGGEKKPKSRKRFCCLTSLASSVDSKPRRKAEKKPTLAHISTLLSSLRRAR